MNYPRLNPLEFITPDLYTINRESRVHRAELAAHHVSRIVRQHVKPGELPTYFWGDVYVEYVANQGDLVVVQGVFAKDEQSTAPFNVSVASNNLVVQADLDTSEEIGYFMGITGDSFDTELQSLLALDARALTTQYHLV